MMTDVASLVRQARTSRQIGQETLARRAGTSQTYISRIERGEVSPSIATVRRLLTAMGLELSMATRPLDPGNSEPRDLQAALRRSTPAERTAEAMELSEFLTDVAVAARNAR